MWTDPAWLAYRAAYTDLRAGYLDELAAANIPADIDILLLRLTALRAGYLDELGPLNIPADIDTLLARLTAARAGFLDDISVLTRPQDGTQATTNALAVIGAAIAAASPFKVNGLLSLHNMQAGDTFLVIEEVRDEDDATYREYGRNSYSDVQTSPMVRFTEKVCQGWRIRIQRTAGADRNVTYQYFTEAANA